MFRKLLKQLSKVPAIVRITKQHLKDILKGFLTKIEIIKVVFKNIFSGVFVKFPVDPYYKQLSWFMIGGNIKLR